MKSYLQILVVLTTLLLVTACASPRVVDHARFDEPHTRSILILPPANETTAAQAPELYFTAIPVPLSEAGYYVFPAPVTQDIMRSEGIVDGAQLQEVPAHRFRELFGADLILRTTITEWDTSYLVLGGSVRVAAHFELISTHTGDVLWSHRDRRVADTTSRNNTSLLGRVLETALNTAQQDYMPLARDLNSAAFSRLPYGAYHPRYVPREVMQQRLREQREAQSR